MKDEPPGNSQSALAFGLGVTAIIRPLCHRQQRKTGAPYKSHNPMPQLAQQSHTTSQVPFQLTHNSNVTSPPPLEPAQVAAS
jgi:hypothetical protein